MIPRPIHISPYEPVRWPNARICDTRKSWTCSGQWHSYVTAAGETVWSWRCHREGCTRYRKTESAA